ncbi:MAG: transrane acid phosphatase [Patescibacteria group bacterium]|nr:transrane acid phosphatase [Patescibacteria group bacterium]
MQRIKYFFGFFPSELFYRLSAVSVCFWAPIALFVVLANEVKEHELLYGDYAILQAIHSMASPALDGLAMVITNAGGPGFILAATLMLTLVLARRRQRRLASFAMFAVGSAVVMNTVLKLIFQRSRPSLWQTLVTEKSYSFPSGHAMASSALAFAVIALCWHTKWRWYVVAGATAYFVAVGLSRVYLGVHYPSDVLGAWCISLAWVVTIYAVARKYGNR